VLETSAGVSVLGIDGMGWRVVAGTSGTRVGVVEDKGVITHPCLATSVTGVVASLSAFCVWGTMRLVLGLFLGNDGMRAVPSSPAASAEGGCCCTFRFRRFIRGFPDGSAGSTKYEYQEVLASSSRHPNCKLHKTHKLSEMPTHAMGDLIETGLVSVLQRQEKPKQREGEEEGLTEDILYDVCCALPLLFGPEDPVGGSVWMVKDSQGGEGEEDGRRGRRHAGVRFGGFEKMAYVRMAGSDGAIGKDAWGDSAGAWHVGAVLGAGGEACRPACVVVCLREDAEGIVALNCGRRRGICASGGGGELEGGWLGDIEV
jgi:hypothetical protein